MGDQFVHLHVHTEYSMLDGAARLRELFAETSRLGMRALAMTDHGNLFGAYDFHKQATAAGVKPILGIEAYVAPRSRHHKKPVFWGSGGRQVDPSGESADVSGAGAYTHLTMLAANAAGLRNLFTLSSLASFEGFYRHPRMDMELIAEHSEGIIVTTGCPGGAVQTRLRLGQHDEAVKAAGQMRDIFGPENLFVEFMDHGLDVERQTRDGLLRLGRQLGLRPLATNDLHYVHERDAARHDAVLCVGAGAQLADAKRFRFSGSGYYLKSAAQMRGLFDGEIPGACDNTLLVADRVESYDEVFAHVDRMPHFDGLPDGETEESWLRKLVDEGMRRKRGPNPPREATERAASELDLIVDTGFPGYFLVVHDICAFMRREGIRFGLRGSAGGSEVVYSLDISPVDPIEHGLLFERFINPERVSPPDIDIDIDERRRGEVIEYATRRYGADRVCQIMNVGRIGAKQAVRDAARVLDLSYSIGDEVSKAMPPDLFGKSMSLADCFDEASPRYRDAQAVRNLYAGNADVKKVIDTGLGFEGLPRQLGVHACGSVMSNRPLLGDMPMFMRQEDGAIISGFPFEQLDELGFYKMDFLGLRNWTVLDDAVRHVEEARGVRVDLDALPFDDPATYELLGRGDTLGVFQLEGFGITSLLRLIRPDRYADIVACLALFRPGPMGVDAHTAYAHRKNGRQKVEPIHPELADALADVLGPTYGLIVFQEQVLAIAREVAGYSLGKADLLRKAMGKKKKEVLDKEFVPFAAGMRERGYSDEAVHALWGTLVPFADYAFGKSHTTTYGRLAYLTAYMKAHYPTEYMAALLTSVGDEKDKLALYLAECRRLGIKVLPPDVNGSGADFTPVGSDIRFGLAAIRNVGAGAVEAIIESRPAGGYTDFGHFLHRVDQAACTKKVVDALIKAGAFDSLGHKRRGLHIEHGAMVELAAKLKKKAAGGQIDLFAATAPTDDAVPPGLDCAFEPVEWDDDKLLGYEREMLGLYVSRHPLAEDADLLARVSTASIAALLSAVDDELPGRVTIAGLVTLLERKISKKNKPYARLLIEDLDAEVPVLLFNGAYDAYGPQLAQDMKVVVDASVKRDGEGLTLFASRVRPLDQVAGAKHARPAGNAGGNCPKPVTLRVPYHEITEGLLQRLKVIFLRHPGDVPVLVELTEGRDNRPRRLPFAVADCPEFRAEVQALLDIPRLRRAA